MCEQPEARTAGFQFNAPTVIGLLYLAAYLTLFSALVGVILAYGWRRQALPDWQQSQFGYLIRTFWIGLAGYTLTTAAGAAGMTALALAGEGTARDAAVFASTVLWLGGALPVTVLLLVRCALVIVDAQQGVPMARPRSWTL